MGTTFTSEQFEQEADELEGYVLTKQTPTQLFQRTTDVRGMLRHAAVLQRRIDRLMDEAYNDKAAPRMSELRAILAGQRDAPVTAQER